MHTDISLKMPVADHMERGVRGWCVDADLLLSQRHQRRALRHCEIQIDAGERVQLIPNVDMEVVA